MRRILLTACVALATTGLAGVGASSAPAASRGLTLFSIATAEQYINNADDRARGRANNPFGNFKDASATSTHPGGAPFPGDQAQFKFVLFTDQQLSKSAGSAIYSCEYNFNKNAFCDAVYTLSGGTLFGEGAFNFSAASFTLTIIGGTGKYIDASGGLEASPGPRHSQRLAFSLA